jgi:hypothetical protein
MKTRLWKIIFAVLFLVPVCAKATTIDFNENGTITDGNVFDTVNIWDNANVTMTGGVVAFCNTYNSGILNYNDGDLHFLYTYQTSQAWLYANESTECRIYDQSIVHLYNGGLVASALIYDDAELHIYGYNLEYIIGGPDMVEGFWPDNQFFSIFIRNSPEGALRDNVFLHEIPEPSTLSLLGLFVLFTRKRGDFSSSGIKRL